MPNIGHMVQALRPSALLTTSRVVVYSLLSTLAMSAVIVNAFLTRNNFYSVAVYLARSNRSALILANFAGLLALLTGRIMQQIFFGPLRPLELERLYDRMWFFLTESLLAFTIFRDEFDAAFGVMFGFLLFIKCFHWLMSDRIEWMDQVPYPGPNILFHIRILSLFGLLSFTDLMMLAFAAESILTHGVGGIVLFGSEYAILMAGAFNCLAKYVVFAYDQRRARLNGGENAPAWENKSMHIFYIELVTDFLKLLTYLTFFLLVLTFYGLPLNIIRDVYITGRSFYQRIRDLVRYRAATKNMDERYPNATDAEILELSDKTCIICREEMSLHADSIEGSNQNAPGSTGGTANGPNVTPKKLPCGHIFHFHCLRSWLERQQSCPTCRRSVLESPTSVTGTTNRAPQQPVGQRPARRHGGAQRPGGLLGRVFREPGAVLHPEQELGQGHLWRYNQPDMQPQQPLLPPAQFEGFNMGPNDAWHPWEPVNGHMLRDTALEAGQPSNEQHNSLDPNNSPVNGADQTLNPREAAALAALNRLKLSSRAELSSQPSQANQGASASQANKSGNKVPPPTNSSGSPSRLPTASDVRSQQLRVPALIPLFEPSITRPRHSSLSASLPSSISDEQLARLDSMTRDAIDERLRVLDGVQNALWKSAEELLRMKSVLPDLNIRRPPPASDTSSPINLPPGPNNELPPTDKGKSKESTSPLSESFTNLKTTVEDDSTDESSTDSSHIS